LDRNQGHVPGSKREGIPEVLGPYSLRAEIARGELSTVHLAQKHGALGFQRLFAVKRLKGHFAHKPELAQLLIDEARLTAGLHHANVASVHDVGEGECYVAMDYVEGENLQILLSRAARDRHPRYVAPVVVDLLNGLHAVHTATGVLGEPLNMVHQAPTARHVIVGTDGIARLADFSQALANIVIPTRQRQERLRVAHMAPEQATSPDHVDYRTDLFIVGLTLWEALTGERLFAAESDAHTFQNVLHKRVPRPSEVGLRPPRCFDAVVMRALERDPAQRYGSALEMARELRDIALTQALYATAGEVGHWVKALAGNELAERRQRVGSEPPPRMAPSDERGSSGLFSSSRIADPYRSGRVHGGSYSHVPGREREPDFEETPTMGMKTTVEKPKRMRITEVDARDERASQAPDSPDLTPSGARVSPPSDRPRHPTVPYETPAQMRQRERDEGESTNPEGFIPARPGARRDSSQPSPGAYSEVKPRRASEAAPQPRRSSEPGARRRSRAPDLFEDVDTSRLDLLGRRSASPAPAQNPLGPLGMEEARAQGEREAAFSQRPKSDPLLRRPVTEGPGSVGGRRDSLGARLTLPEGPVGLPIEVPEPEPARPFEQRAARPPRLPAALPATFEQQAASRRAYDDVMTMPDSLQPPSVAARTAPPVQRRESRGRGVGFWISAGLLTGVIAVAGVVGVRNWTEQPHAAGAGVASQPLVPAPAPAPQVEPEKVVTPAVEAAPQQVAAPAEPPAVAAEQPVVPAEVQPAAPAAAEPAEPAPVPGRLALPEVTVQRAPQGAAAAPAAKAPATQPKVAPRGRPGAWKAKPKAVARPAGSLMPVFEQQPVGSELRERKPRDRTALPANPY
jgi:serine/threonine protein kinase